MNAIKQMNNGEKEHVTIRRSLEYKIAMSEAFKLVAEDMAANKQENKRGSEGCKKRRSLCRY